MNKKQIAIILLITALGSIGIGYAIQDLGAYAFILLVIVIPALCGVVLLIALAKIAYKLLSKTTSAEEKKGTLKRLAVVTMILLVGLLAFLFSKV